MAQNFMDRLQDSVILADGAMGTVLYEKGIFVNQCFDGLNLSSPDLVIEVHRDYLRVGAELIETNTFGANRFKLAPYGLEDKVVEINRAGVELARRAVEDSRRDAFVAGSVGPLGNPQKPHGLSPEQIHEIYSEQIHVLIAAGIDVLFIETISRQDEMRAALEVANKHEGLPIVAQMTFGEDGLTVEGQRPKALASWMSSLGAAVVGCNCSTGPRAMLDVLGEMNKASDDLILSALPNAGSPEWVEGRYIYFSSPEYLATYARRFIKGYGVGVVGGCCGTTPDHIRAMRDSIRALHPTRVEVLSTQETEENGETPHEPVPIADRSRFANRLHAGAFVTSVEIPPPKGADPTKVLDRVRRLHRAGVDAVNIPDGPRASARMSPMALGALIRRDVGAEPILHYCCRDRNLLGMQSDLLGAHAIGIHNLIIITGDPPKLGDYPDATAVFDVDAIGLTRIVDRMNHGLDLASNPLGAPTGFHIAVGVNPGAMNLDEEVRRFRAKYEAGAEAAFTQPVFDGDKLSEFLDRTEDIPIPILVGILPLNSHRNAEFFHNEVPGMEVPDEVREHMRKAGSGDVAKKVGVEIAREALATARHSSRIRGAYVMPPFGNPERALEVLVDVLDANSASPQASQPRTSKAKS